jgi:hypothetical protein
MLSVERREAGPTAQTDLSINPFWRCERLDEGCRGSNCCIWSWEFEAFIFHLTVGL